MTTEAKKRAMVQAGLLEIRAAPDFHLNLEIDLGALVAVVAALQLAMRHPGFRGASASITREFVDSAILRIRDAGYVATAAFMELGDDPAYDDKSVKGRPR